MKSFACPFEKDRCGTDTSEIILSSDGTPAHITTKSGFDVDRVCNYHIKAPEDAQDGDWLYFKLEALNQATPYATLGTFLTDKQDAFCWLK